MPDDVPLEGGLGGRCRKGNGERSEPCPTLSADASWLLFIRTRYASRQMGGGAKEGTCGGWGDSERPCCSWRLPVESASRRRARQIPIINELGKRPRSGHRQARRSRF